MGEHLTPKDREALAQLRRDIGKMREALGVNDETAKLEELLSLASARLGILANWMEGAVSGRRGPITEVDAQAARGYADAARPNHKQGQVIERLLSRIAQLEADRDELRALLQEAAATDMAQLRLMRQRGIHLPDKADTLLDRVLDRVEPFLHDAKRKESRQR